ncbi:XRE family transcriptional regulator [Sphingomonas oligophenolica]|uniref:XRE family transcriptional regulator n=1 Tax=Sphingomonas oligophenolica TaxID=301154 RepID=UPI003CFE655A
MIGVGQPDLTKLLGGQYREMSVERLLRMLTRLGCGDDISVQSAGRALEEAIDWEAVAA